MGYRYIPLTRRPEIDSLIHVIQGIPELRIIGEGNYSEYSGGINLIYSEVGRIVMTFGSTPWEYEGRSGSYALSLQFVRHGSERRKAAIKLLNEIPRRLGDIVPVKKSFKPAELMRR